MAKNAFVSKQQSIASLYRLSWATFSLALALSAFFNLSKHEPFKDINPFAVDPYDVVGSLGFQLALGISLLSLARAWQIKRMAKSEPRAGWVLHGLWATFAVITIVLVTDTAAIWRSSLPLFQSIWVNLLIAGIVALALFALALVIALGRNSQRLDWNKQRKVGGSLDTAILDLLTFFTAPFLAAQTRWPVLKRLMTALLWPFELSKKFVAWFQIEEHPWRFVIGLGLSLGLALLFAKFVLEGPPPDSFHLLLITTVFLGFELLFSMLAFFSLGRYLGLR